LRFKRAGLAAVLYGGHVLHLGVKLAFNAECPTHRHASRYHRAANIESANGTQLVVEGDNPFTARHLRAGVGGFHFAYFTIIEVFSPVPYTRGSMKKIQIITLFPEMFEGVLGNSMLWKAQDRGIAEYSYINLRDFGLGPRRQVDDTPYGGGDGMLLKPEPLVAAIELAKKNDPGALVLLPTPRGKVYKQSDAKELAASEHGLILICPRYEGYDERVTQWVDRQYCIGSYVLTGGELASMVVIDSVVRLLPGVLGGETSADIESFQDDDVTIEFPQYTRPEVFRDMKVPDVLLSGHHGEIDKWRASESARATEQRS
jgi:tRNA (guanine37-N1)-methyltransferase